MLHDGSLRYNIGGPIYSGMEARAWLRASTDTRGFPGGRLFSLCLPVQPIGALTMRQPARYSFSLLRVSAASRLAVAVAVVALLWLGVYWAMA